MKPIIYEFEKRGAKHSAETKSHLEALRKAHKEMGKHLDALGGKDVSKRLADVGELLAKVRALP